MDEKWMICHLSINYIPAATDYHLPVLLSPQGVYRGRKPQELAKVLWGIDLEAFYKEKGVKKSDLDARCLTGFLWRLLDHGWEPIHLDADECVLRKLYTEPLVCP